MKLCSSLIILSIVCLFTVACSDENESTGVENNDVADQNGTVTVVDSTETATDTTDTSEDSNQSVSTGLQPIKTLDVNGVSRSYYVYIPSGFESSFSFPVVLNFHGFGGNARDHASYTNMQSVADEASFLLVFPQGSLLGGVTHWNPSAIGPGNKSEADDYSFVAMMLTQLALDYSIDSQRIYAMGYSNGGMMALGLACHPDSTIAAAVSISGAMLQDVGDSCSPPQPTAILSVHGTNDGVIPYNGGSGYWSVSELMSYWQTTNQTNVAASEKSVSHNGQTITYQLYDNGTAGTQVAHYRVEGGEHIWFNFVFEDDTFNQRLWQFISTHQL